MKGMYFPPSAALRIHIGAENPQLTNIGGLFIIVAKR